MTLQSLSLSSIRPYVEYSAARGSALLTCSKEYLRTLSKVQWAAAVCFPVLALLFYQFIKWWTAPSKPEHVVIVHPNSSSESRIPKNPADLSIRKSDSSVAPTDPIPTKQSLEEISAKNIEKLEDTIREDAIDTFPGLLALYHRWDGIVKSVQNLIILMKNPGWEKNAKLKEPIDNIAGSLSRWPPFKKYFNDSKNAVAGFLKIYSNEKKLEEIKQEALLIKESIKNKLERNETTIDMSFQNMDKHIGITAGYTFIDPEKNGVLQEFMYGKSFFKLCKESGTHLDNPFSSKDGWKQVVILPYALTDKELIYEVFVFKRELPSWNNLSQLKYVHINDILFGTFPTNAKTVQDYILPKKK